MKQSVKLGLLLLVVAALVAGGVAFASDDDATTAPVAGNEEIRARTGLRDRLQPLVDAGTISETQADAVAEHLADGVRPREHRPDPRRSGFEMVGAVADFLGLTGEELRAELAGGATLGEVASANGSSPALLVQHLIGLAETRLDEAVAAGRLTAEQRADALARMTEHLTEAVENGRPAPPADARRGPAPGDPHHRGPGHRGDGHGPGPLAPGSDAALNT